MAVNSNKRIAKNTFYLYIRMAFVLIITLFTTRVLLRALGVSDYGIYNVVGGVVAFVGFIKASIGNGFQRYYNVALGKKDEKRLEVYFRVSFAVLIFLCAIFFILAETLGLFIVNTQLQIPSERMTAANVVYQSAILIFILNLFVSPYHAVIIAYEKMGIYAILSVFQTIAKLIIVYVIMFVSFDRLIFYNYLLIIIDVFFLAISVIIVFKIINNHLKPLPVFNREIIKEMTSFTGWNLFGSFSHIFKEQGINMLLNVFFGPTINAARGIAYQISGGLTQFYSNFQIASRPQIIQNYAAGNHAQMINLVNMVSRLSFVLMWIMALPFIFSMTWVLNFWLGEQIPDKTVEFSIIVILIQVITSLATPISNVVHATGKMKNFQLVCGAIISSTVFFVYIALKLGSDAITAMIIALIITPLIQVVRILMLKRIIDFSAKHYVKEVIIPCFFVVCVSLVFPIITKIYIGNSLHPIGHILIAFLSSSFFGFFIGFRKNERNAILAKVKIRSIIQK